MFGTTFLGGGGQACALGCGTVFELSPNQGGWTETIVHSFAGGTDGAEPEGGVLLDAQGDVFGTALAGGNGKQCSAAPGGGQKCGAEAGGSQNCSGGGPGCGIVFELIPDGKGGYTENILHTFTGGSDGAGPSTSLTADSSGNLYGTAGSGGLAGCGSGCGTAFELIKPKPGKTVWAFVLLHGFTGGSDGGNPDSPLLQATKLVPGSADVSGSAATGGTGANGADFIIHRGAPAR